MSLVAIVYCRCVEEGKACTPPFDRSLLVNEADGRLSLKLPDGPEKQMLKEQKHQWEKNCCTHAWRHYLNEWICDWQGVKMFHRALIDLGAERFPTLMEFVPMINTGLVSSQDSSKALKELEVFEQCLAQGKFMLASLVMVDFNMELCANSYKHERCIYFSEDHEYWLDGHGVRILGHDNEEPVFESQHFEQALAKADSKTDSTSHPDAVVTVFTDKKTGATYKAKGDVRLQDMRHPNAIPTELKVESRACSVDAFDYIVKPLKKAFQASVDVSHPVIWG